MTRRPLTPRAGRILRGFMRDMEAAETGFVKKPQPAPTILADPDTDDRPEPEPIPGLATDDEKTLGNLVWHSSDEDSGPDVGMSLGLGEKTMWVGEITRFCWDELSDEQKGQIGGNDHGWFLMLYPDGIPIAKFVDAHEAGEFINEIYAAIQKATRGRRP